MSASASLRAKDLHKRYGGDARAPAALAGISLQLDAGAHLCVMGHSGSGKTTLLRAIAGLEQLDAGEIWIGATRVDTLAAERRPTRTVFQAPALFPHLSVLDNVRFVDRLGARAGVELPAASLRAEELLERLGVDPGRFGERRPAALSGGERQRVALARALYRPPPWVLLDEPLSALDRPRRVELRRILAGLRQELGLSMLHVTHAAPDALALADELVVLDAGRVIAQGAPATLYRRPPNLTCARLLGEVTPVPTPAGEGPQRWLRPERLRLVEPARGRVQARLIARVCVGPSWEHELRVDHLSSPVVVAASRPWEAGETCGLTWDDDDTLAFAPP